MQPLALFLSLLIAAAPGALADSISQDEAREAVKKGDIRPLSDAIAKAESAYQGHLLDAELEREDGKYVYEIKMMTKEGWRRKLYLDAQTLEIMKEKAKPPHDKKGK
ncbi:MAG: PepSY domain-containing protein [Alphaproteobacteria bacterium]|nr:PepSY domain-containing protein [Alphaproteobacteria bacterium]